MGSSPSDLAIAGRAVEMTVASSISMKSAQPTIIGARNSSAETLARAGLIAAELPWIPTTIRKSAERVNGWIRGFARSIAVARGRRASLVAAGLRGNPRAEQFAQPRFYRQIARGSLAPPPRANRDDRLGHVAMSPGAADLTE